MAKVSTGRRPGLRRGSSRVQDGNRHCRGGLWHDACHHSRYLCTVSSTISLYITQHFYQVTDGHSLVKKWGII